MAFPLVSTDDLLPVKSILGNRMNSRERSSTIGAMEMVLVVGVDVISTNRLDVFLMNDCIKISRD